MSGSSAMADILHRIVLFTRFIQAGVFGATLVVHGFDGTNDTLELDNLFIVHANAVASFTVTPHQVVIPDQPYSLPKCE